MFRDVSTDNAGDAAGEALPGADGGVIVFVFEDGPKLFEKAGAFESEEESKNKDEDDICSDAGDSADAGDKEIAEVVDEGIGEVLYAGEDFLLEIVNADGLTEIINTIPAAEGVLKSGRELADELDGLVDDDGDDDSENDAEDDDNKTVG